MEDFITKKIISLVLVFVLCLCISVPSFAGSGVSSAEMQVLKMMDRGAKQNSLFYQYRNALKTYFNRDGVSITQVNADSACEVLLKIYDTYDMSDFQNERRFFEDFLYVLLYLGIRVSYDRANSTADFIGSDGSIVMAKLDLIALESGGRTVRLNPIKKTGLDSSALIIGSASCFVIVLAIATIILKIKLRKREGNHGSQQI